MKYSISEKLIYLISLILFIIFTLGPILWALNIALTPEVEITKVSNQLISNQLTLENFQALMDPSTEAHQTIFPALINSVKMALISILIGLPIATITAYAFYRYHFFAKAFLFVAIIMTMVIPVFTTIIPIYAMFAQRGMLDNFFWIAIIYVSAFLPLTTWVIYTYFKSLPYEVIEAAMMDGASEAQIFFETILPMSWPILVTSTLLLFLMSWSQFQIPMILTTSQENKVITLVIQDFQGRYTISYGLIAASGIITILPPAILAVVFRRFLVSGLTTGATKG